MSPLSSFGLAVLAIYTASSMVVAPVCLLIALDSTREARALAELTRYYSTNHRYLLDGASDRGLLDICEREGEIRVSFKEDCEADHG